MKQNNDTTEIIFSFINAAGRILLISRNSGIIYFLRRICLFAAGVAARQTDG